MGGVEGCKKFRSKSTIGVFDVFDLCVSYCEFLPLKDLFVFSEICRRTYIASIDDDLWCFLMQRDFGRRPTADASWFGTFPAALPECPTYCFKMQYRTQWAEPRKEVLRYMGEFRNYSIMSMWKVRFTLLKFNRMYSEAVKFGIGEEVWNARLMGIRRFNFLSLALQLCVTAGIAATTIAVMTLDYALSTPPAVHQHLTTTSLFSTSLMVAIRTAKTAVWRWITSPDIHPRSIWVATTVGVVGVIALGRITKKISSRYIIPPVQPTIQEKLLAHVNYVVKSFNDSLLAHVMFPLMIPVLSRTMGQLINLSEPILFQLTIWGFGVAVVVMLFAQKFSRARDLFIVFLLQLAFPGLMHPICCFGVKLLLIPASLALVALSRNMFSLYHLSVGLLLGSCRVVLGETIIDWVLSIVGSLATLSFLGPAADSSESHHVLQNSSLCSPSVALGLYVLATIFKNAPSRTASQLFRDHFLMNRIASFVLDMMLIRALVTDGFFQCALLRIICTAIFVEINSWL